MKVAFTLLFLLAALGVGCAPEPELVLPPDEGASAALGERGAYGVARLARVVRARVDDVVEVDVLAPADASGELLEGPFPVVVFIHGGLVGQRRYEWLTRHIASRGFVVVAPAHRWQLAFFEQGAGPDALAALRAIAEDEDDPLHGVMSDAPGAVVGHSLGGVIAASIWLDHPLDFDLLVLTSSIPLAGDDFASRTPGGRVLSITGGRDGRIGPEEVDEGAAQIAASGAPTTAAVVLGMNHVQWTDEVTDDERANDDEPTVDTALARERSLYMIDAALNTLTGEPDTILAEPMLWPEGVTTMDGWRAQEGQ